MVTVSGIVSYTCGLVSDGELTFLYAGLGCVTTAEFLVHSFRGCVSSMLVGREGRMQGELQIMLLCG